MAARVTAPDAPADAAAAAAAGELALGADQLMWLAETGVKTTRAGAPGGKATLRAILSADGFVDSASAAGGAPPLGLVLDATPFVSRGETPPGRGTLVFEARGLAFATFQVTAVRDYGGYVLHLGSLEEGSVATGAEVECKVEGGGGGEDDNPFERFGKFLRGE